MLFFYFSVTGRIVMGKCDWGSDMSNIGVEVGMDNGELLFFFPFSVSCDKKVYQKKGIQKGVQYNTVYGLLYGLQGTL